MDVPSYKLTEAASVIGISVQTLRRYIKSGRAKAQRLSVGREAYVLTENEVLRLAEERARRRVPIGSNKVLALQYIEKSNA